MGAFKWVDYEQDAWIDFEAITDHYRQPPFVSNLHYALVVEDGTRQAMLSVGEADLIGVSPQQIKELEANPDVRLSYPYLNVSAESWGTQPRTSLGWSRSRKAHLLFEVQWKMSYRTSSGASIHEWNIVATSR